MSSSPAIEARELGKSYRFYDRASARLIELATLGLWQGHRNFWALRQVELEVARGETLGLVGPNGAGKSTLLRLLSGATWPSEGRYRVQGRVGALLELGASFHGELSGRENVRLAGLVAGLTSREARAKEPEILDFAEIGEFVDAPVTSYSTGMGLRLAFAVATAIEPDVLLIDEAFAVGDLGFQKKCVDRILALQRRGTTIVLASHSLYDLRQLCTRALWLDQGRVRGLGDARAVTHDYAAFHGANAAPGERREPAPGEPRVLAVRLQVDGAASASWEIQAGASLAFEIEWENPRAKEGALQLALGFRRQDQTLVGAAATHFDALELAGPRGRATLELPACPLLAGTYEVLCVLFDAAGVHRHHEFAPEHNLVVRSDARELGLVRLVHRWRLEARESERAP